MKSAIAIFVACAGLARADLVIVQTVEGGGQMGEQKIRIQGDQARSDLGAPVSVITDGATGEMTTLMHAGKTYLKVSAAQTKAMTEQLQKQRPGGAPAPLVPTGRKEKLGEYECEIFTVHLGAVTATYWIAKDFPDYPAVLAQLDRFQSGAVSAMGGGLMPAVKDFPGMIMKTELSMAGKKTVTTLISAKDEPVDPAIFRIPAGYKEATSPTLNFQPTK